MHIQPVHTERVTAGSHTLTKLIEAHVSELPERAVLAVTSKLVSLCENALAPADSAKDDLIVSEASHYLPAEYSAYGHHFTITRNTLIASAGIDESNAGGGYLLWPRDPQASANRLRAWLAETYGLKEVGVVITDSTSMPLRRGVSGIALAHSGFQALRNYIGEPDLFGKPFAVSLANISGGLAAAATLAMGEGAEQTPLALISDIPFVTFQPRDPTPAELAEAYVRFEDDLFAPILQSVPWQSGGNQAGA